METPVRLPPSLSESNTDVQPFSGWRTLKLKIPRWRLRSRRQEDFAYIAIPETQRLSRNLRVSQYNERLLLGIFESKMQAFFGPQHPGFCLTVCGRIFAVPISFDLNCFSHHPFFTAKVLRSRRSTCPTGYRCLLVGSVPQYGHICFCLSARASRHPAISRSGSLS